MYFMLFTFLGGGSDFLSGLASSLHRPGLSFLEGTCFWVRDTKRKPPFWRGPLKTTHAPSWYLENKSFYVARGASGIVRIRRAACLLGEAAGSLLKTATSKKATDSLSD